MIRLQGQKDGLGDNIIPHKIINREMGTGWSVSKEELDKVSAEFDKLRRETTVLKSRVEELEEIVKVQASHIITLEETRAVLMDSLGVTKHIEDRKNMLLPQSAQSKMFISRPVVPVVLKFHSVNCSEKMLDSLEKEVLSQKGNKDLKVVGENVGTVAEVNTLVFVFYETGRRVDVSQKTKIALRDVKGMFPSLQKMVGVVLYPPLGLIPDVPELDEVVAWFKMRLDGTFQALAHDLSDLEVVSKLVKSF